MVLHQSVREARNMFALSTRERRKRAAECLFIGRLFNHAAIDAARAKSGAQTASDLHGTAIRAESAGIKFCSPACALSKK
jgi:hypothetical protein